jgi:hypothetical protein
MRSVYMPPLYVARVFRLRPFLPHLTCMSVYNPLLYALALTVNLATCQGLCPYQALAVANRNATNKILEVFVS